MDKINQNIKKARKEKGYTQAEMAKLLGMKTSTYSQMERMGNVPAQTVLELASALKINLLEIMDPENLQIDKPEEVEKVAQPEVEVEEKEDAMSLTNREKNMVLMLRNLTSGERDEIYTTIKDAHDKSYKKED